MAVSGPSLKPATRNMHMLALGQILLYAQNDNDPRIKKIVIVGQYPANPDEIAFIEYLKSNLKIEFDYEHVELK